MSATRSLNLVRAYTSACFIFTLLRGAPSACGQAGAPDTSFNSSPGPNAYVKAILLQPDGKILIGGDFRQVDNVTRNFICRLNTNGTLDTPFASGVGPDGQVSAMLLQPDGKILIGGWFYHVDEVVRGGLARLNADGSLDTSFTPETSGFERVRAVALQSDGKVLVATDSTFQRLLSSGARDTNFGVIATAQEIPFEGGTRFVSTFVYAIAPLENGKILIGGEIGGIGGQALGGGLLRLNANGTLDPSFQSFTNWIVRSLMIQPDGRIVIGSNGRLARLLADGTPDEAFDPPAFQGDISALARQPDGKIFAAGYFFDFGGIPRVSIARLDRFGSLDRDFDAGLERGSDIGAVALQGDGRLIIGGSFEISGNLTRRHISRLKGDSLNFPGRFEFLSVSNSVNEAAGAMVIPVGRYGGSAGVATVRYATGQFGSATPGSDYQPITGTLTFAAGQTSNFFTVPILDDQVVEDHQAFETVLSAPAGGAMLGNPSSAVGFILDDDCELGFSKSIFTVLEAGTNAVITVSRRGATNETVTVQYQTANGTARAGEDYVSRSGFLSFGVGETHKAFQIPIVHDESAESLETVLLELSNPVGRAVLGFQSNAILRIIDDAPGAVDPAFYAGMISGYDGLGWVATLAVQGDGEVFVGGNFLKVQGQARMGFARLNEDGLLDAGFNSGEGASPPVLNASALQADGRIVIGGRFFSVNELSRKGIAQLNADGSVDTTFNPAIGGAMQCLAVQADGKVLVGGEFHFVGGNITRLNPNGTLDPGFDPGTGANGWITALALQPDGKVIVGGGFTSFNGVNRRHLVRLHPNGSLDTKFVPGVEFGEFTSPVVDTLALQPDGRILVSGNIQLGSGGSQLRLVRLNNDGSLDATFNGAAVTEGRALTVQAGGKILLGAIDRRIVRLHADGSLDPSFDAGLGATFANTPGSIATIALQANGMVLVGGFFDEMNGIARSSLVRLKNDSNSAAGRIELASSMQVVAESAQRVTVTVRRVDGSNGVLVVPYATIGDTSTAGADYTPQTGVISFADGDVAEKTITIPIIEDSLAEGDEIVRFSLGRPIGGATWGRFATAAITIVDNDTVVQVAADRLRLRENQGSAAVEVQRLGSRSGTVTVGYFTSAGTAQGGADYIGQSNTLTFAEGETNKTLQVSILDDTLAEDDETFHLTLNQLTGGAMFGSNVAVVLTIVDNERPGTLDTTFDPGTGLCEASVYGYGQVYALEILRDGRILVGGRFEQFNGVACHGAVRLLPDGSVDPTFDLAFTYPGAEVRGIAIQPDGKVLVLVRYLFGSSFIARYFPDGSPDESFNSFELNYGFIRALKLQPDGKILFCGSFENANGRVRTGVARLNPDGSLDESFAPDLEAEFDRDVVSLAVETGGKIIVGGNFNRVNGVSRYGLARLNTDGSLDPSFDTGMGLANEYGVQYEAYPNCIVVQPDGKVLIGGQFWQVNGVYRTNIARLNPDGSLDNNFNANVAHVYGYYSPIWTLVLQPDHKVLVGGTFTSVNGVFRNGVARLNPDGSLDAGFYSGDEEPWLEAYFPFAEVYSLALEADGQIIVGGNFSQMDGERQCGIARLNGAVRVLPPNPNQAVQEMIATVNGSSLPDRHQRPLLATLLAALASFERSNTVSAVHQLQAFQKKIRAQLAQVAPELADELWQAAQVIIDSVQLGQERVRFTAVTKSAQGRIRLKVTGIPAAIYYIQATTNLTDWSTVGVTTELGNGVFEFEDRDSDKIPARLYRIIKP